MMSHAGGGERHQQSHDPGEQALASPEYAKILGQIELASCHLEQGRRVVLMIDRRGFRNVFHDLARSC
jgi:hypothetical protein